MSGERDVRGVADDTGQTRTFGTARHLRRHLPFALFMAALGLAVLAMADGSRRADRTGVIAGFVLIGAGLTYLGYFFYRETHPAKPNVELSPRGILYRITPQKEALIPWDEIHGVESVDIRGPRMTVFRNVTVVLVSRQFYHDRIHIDSLFRRGPAWGYFVIPNGDQVRIAFHHELAGVPAREMREAVESRWRAFSKHPNAKLPGTPFREYDPLFVIPKAVKRGAILAAALMALPAIYYWHYGVALLRSSSMSDGSAAAFLRDALDGEGVAARLPSGGIAQIRRRDISDASLPLCHVEIARDDSVKGKRTPRYAFTTFCTADLQLAAGGSAVGLVKIIEKTFETESWNGEKRTSSAWAIAPVAAAEAEAKLCKLGFCAMRVRTGPN